MSTFYERRMTNAPHTLIWLDAFNHMLCQACQWLAKVCERKRVASYLLIRSFVAVFTSVWQALVERIAMRMGDEIYISIVVDNYTIPGDTCPVKYQCYVQISVPQTLQAPDQTWMVKDCLVEPVFHTLCKTSFVSNSVMGDESNHVGGSRLVR